LRNGQRRRDDLQVNRAIDDCIAACISAAESGSRWRASWCPGAESNHRHCDFQSHALPTELPGRATEGLKWPTSGRFIVGCGGAVHHASPSAPPGAVRLRCFPKLLRNQSFLACPSLKKDPSPGSHLGMRSDLSPLWRGEQSKLRASIIQLDLRVLDH